MILFGFDHYYPCGGMNDVIGEFDSTEKAVNHIKNEFKKDKYSLCDYYQLVDFSTMKILDLEDQIFQIRKEDEKFSKSIINRKNIKDCFSTDTVKSIIVKP